LATVDDLPVACKQLKSDSEDLIVDSKSKQYKEFIEEARIMSKIPPSPYVLKLIGICEQPPCMLTEFVGGGSLFDKLMNPDVKIGQLQAMQWVKEICNGLNHLHNNKIIHR